MKRRIIIKEQKITRAGQLKHFQVPLPKNTTKVVAIAADVRFDSEFDGTGDSFFRGMERSDSEDMIWTISDNPLAGRLIMQSMEKANIFFYEPVWAINFDDGISNLESVESMSAFGVQYKKEPKAVEVPIETTVLNCLYKDMIGNTLGRDFIYRVKVIVWIEYNA